MKNNDLSRVRKAKNPSAVNWKLADRGRISLGNQLLIEVYSNYLRATRGKKFLRADPHASERVEAELTLVKVVAEFLNVPQWRVMDVVLAYGIAELYEKFEPLLKIKAEHYHKIAALADQVTEAHDSVGDDVFAADEQYAEVTLDTMIAEAFPDYIIRRANRLAESEEP